MYRSIRLVVSLMVIAAAAVAQSSKKYQNQAEFQIYDAAVKEMAGRNFSKALADLDAWARDFPNTDYKEDRQLLYVEAYAGDRQPAKALGAAGELLSKQDLETTLGGAANVVKLFYTAATAIEQIPSPTAEQLATAGQAARRLLAYERTPEGMTAAAWQQARAELQVAARGALIYVALVPGTEAMQKNDCPAAEFAFTKALGDFPDSAQAAWYLGTADLCLYKTRPDRAVPAIYAIARAAALDPAKGMVDPKWQQGTVLPFLEKLFDQYHGSDPAALQQLQDLAVRSPFPPAGFTIQSITQRLQAEEAAFEKNNPQLALWMKIKAALADTNGEEYFVSNLQNAAVPQLHGVLVEARPACRPKELLVAVPLPGTQQPLSVEIALRLDKPLAGKPELNTEFQWEGVPTAFTRSPFLLTMETEITKIDGLKSASCTAAPARRTAPTRKR